MKESSRTKSELLEEISELKKKIKKLEKAEEKLRKPKPTSDTLLGTLRESQERLYLALEASSVGAWDLDLVDHSAFRSPQHDRIFGYPELLPQWTYEIFLEHVLPEDRPEVDRKFKHAMETHGEWNFECRIRRVDGEVRCIWASGRHLSDNTATVRRMAGIVHDINDRRQAVAAMIENEKRFTSAFEFAAIGMALVSPEGTFLKVNQALCNYLGYTQEELTALTFQEITHPDDLEADLAYVHQMLAGEINTYQMEKRYFGKQGNLIWIILSVSLVRDEQNKPQYFISQIQNITARKLAEEQSRSNMQLLQMVIDHSQYLIYAKDLDGRFILASLSLANFFGQRSPELLIGKTSHDFLPKEIADQHRTNDLEVIARQSLISFEETANTKDGLHTFITNKFPLLDGNGKIYAVCGTSVDITERKQMEDELHKLSSYNRSLIEVSLDPLVTIDHSGRIADVNIATEQATGCSRQELIGTDFSDYFADTEKAREGYQTVFQEGIVRDYPLEIRHRDGHITAVLYNASVYRDRTNKIMGIFAAARDITERKQAEAQRAALEAQNRQLQKSESLSRMAGAIAHHFNNQLGVVIGNLEMAIDKQPKDAPPSKSLASAMDAAWRSADMSGLMLTYLGQTHNERESLDLSFFCRKILPLIKSTLPGNVVMETDFPLPRPIIMANTGEIQQILTNLITNAREAIGNDKGTISLSIKTVSPIDIPTKNRFPINWQPQNNTYACLEVADTGSGIEDKDIEKLFDPFFSTKFTGRGMGLAAVLGIVNSHKGVITVDSKPGRGSTFLLFLPVPEEAQVKPQTAENDRDVTISKPPPGKMEEGGTVLLIEDEEPLRKMVAIMLKRLSFTALEAKDGIEALEIFGQHQSEIKFVLTDLTMPRMDGWETLTALRKLAPGIPVILASGYDKTHVMEGDHPELPQVFLGKPYNLKALRNAITQTLESRKK